MKKKLVCPVYMVEETSLLLLLLSLLLQIILPKLFFSLQKVFAIFSAGGQTQIGEMKEV